MEYVTGPRPRQVYVAPLDVLLPADPEQADSEVETVVQPDLSVFCDPARLTEAGTRGAPDLVVDPSGSVQIYHLAANSRYDDPDIFVKNGRVPAGLRWRFGRRARARRQPAAPQDAW